jgi:hypothetical protein
MLIVRNEKDDDAERRPCDLCDLGHALAVRGLDALKEF